MFQSAERRQIWRLKGKSTLLFSLLMLACGAAVFGYWALSRSGGRSVMPGKTYAVAQTGSGRLSRTSAEELLRAALARHPIVARLPLGDVITIDRYGKAAPLYPRLAEANIVKLRVCHFPGAGGAGNQICLAELTDYAKQYLYEGDSAANVVTFGHEDFRPSNRAFAELEVAQPRLESIDQIDERGGDAVVTYTVRFETTPLAEAFALARERVQIKASGKADLRNAAGGWHIQNDGLQQIALAE